MQLQLITLCDSASDYQGKLCVLGSFDTLCAREFPVVHPQCSLAMRWLFEPADVGRHQLGVELRDDTAKLVMPAFTPLLDVSFPPGAVPFVTRNVVMNLQRMRFEREGVYRFFVLLDGQDVTSLPVRVTRFENMRAPNLPAG